MTIIFGIIAAIAVFFMLYMAERSFAERKDGVSKVALQQGVLFAAVVSLVTCGLRIGVSLVGENQPQGWMIWEVVFLIITLATMIALSYRFIDCDADSAKEIIGYTITLVILLFLGLAAAHYIAAGAYGHPVAQTIAVAMPWIAATLVFATFLWVMFEIKWVGFFPLVLAIVLISFLVSLGTGIAKSKMPAPETEEEIITTEYGEVEDIVPPPEFEESEDEGWAAFYNLSLLYDDDEDNNFNFGWNPYEESKEVDWYDADFRERLSRDPAFGAAVMAWVDYWCKTRYIGIFYDECDGEWDAAINAAKEAFIADEELYFDTLISFEEFLDTAKVELRYAKSGITDQMFMNPYTIDGIPDVIVMKTDNHDGHFLVYTFTIKGQEVTVGYRIECGYQPTNVEKTMKINPTPKPTPSGKGEDPGKKPDDPKKPDPKKDPTKGTQGELVIPNDNPGPGPDTNNGNGATESKVEENPNSQDGTYQEYKEQMQELKEINSEQKVGGDPSKPTTPTPKPDASQGQTTVPVDSNAEKGTGNGSVDQPTPVQPVATDATTGKPITNTPDNPAGEWEGPAD